MIGTGVTVPAGLPWLLAGPAASRGGEPLSAHVSRLGLCPSGDNLITAVAESRLLGRGGARFPTWRKWDAVARRPRGNAVVLVNGAEGEPASAKDRVLMHIRPHLVLDGAALAARAVGASEVVLYVSRYAEQAGLALEAALRERAHGHWAEESRLTRVPTRLVWAPARYVAGEESAAVSFLQRGEARPTVVPPRPFERGVGGRPTLVQNVETLAQVALIARFGSRWFQSQGTPESPGSMLATVSGAVSGPGVYEVPHGTRLDHVVEMAGGSPAAAPGILVGGYFGTWVPGQRAGSIALDDRSATQTGVRLGAGVVFVLPEHACGVAETARILSFLAHESAQQCGPCRLGLAAVARHAEQLAGGWRPAGGTELLQRWAAQLGGGRGACKHPDGAVGLLRSALATFDQDFGVHARQGACWGSRQPAGLPFPPPVEGWC